MKRHHDEGNSCKGQLLIKGWPTGSEVWFITIKVGEWQHPGRHGVFQEESADSSTSLSKGSQEQTVSHLAKRRVSKTPAHSETLPTKRTDLLGVPLPVASIFNLLQSVFTYMIITRSFQSRA